MIHDNALLIKGLMLGAAVVGYKAAIYLSAKHQIDSAKQQQDIEEEDKAE